MSAICYHYEGIARHIRAYPFVSLPSSRVSADPLPSSIGQMRHPIGTRGDGFFLYLSLSSFDPPNKLGKD